LDYLPPIVNKIIISIIYKILIIINYKKIYKIKKLIVNNNKKLIHLEIQNKDYRNKIVKKDKYFKIANLLKFTHN
jgi:hypothetical protein